MPLVIADRVQVTSTTTGTGTLTLGAAVVGYQSFAVIGNGNTTYYTIYDQTTGDWEVGVGTYTASGTTLSRDTVFSSSNANALVNFAAGVKNVFVTYPGARAVYAQPNGVVELTGNLDFSGTGLRIRGDFSNATQANRVMFQTSTVNGVTAVSAIPNGSSAVAAFNAFSNSDPTNSSVFQLQITATEGRINSSVTGTGAYLPTTFYTGGAERMRIGTDGQQSSVIPGGTTLYPEYKCRAWVNFDGTTSPGTIAGSGNVSSVTRNSTGNFTVNFITGMPDVNYAVNGSGQRGVTDSNGDFVIPLGATYSTSAVQVAFRSSTTVTTFLNPTTLGVAVFR